MQCNFTRGENGKPMGFIGRGLGEFESVFFSIPTNDIDKIFETPWTRVHPSKQVEEVFHILKPGEVIELNGFSRDVLLSRRQPIDGSLRYVPGASRIVLGGIVGILSDDFTSFNSQ